MTNSLRKLAKDLKAFAKRCKDFKYTEQALFVFLLCGIVGFADVTTAPTDKAIQNQRQEITTSIGDMRQQFRRVKSENDKLMKNYNLELIQLMEQGDHVVKSPWSSWQFGINYVYNSMSGMYKGKGDKPPKYVYENIYRRGNWEERNAIDTIAGKSVNGDPITPGNENTSTWQTATTLAGVKKLAGVTKLKRDTSIDASTNGKRKWGLVELRKIREPLNEVEIFANVSPKEVKKNKLDIPVSVTPPATLSAPVVKPNVNKPTEAPKVNLPNPPVLKIPGNPNLSFSPTISVLKVEKVGNITVNPANVTPVDFILEPAALSNSRNFQRTYAQTPQSYNLNSTPVVVNNVSTRPDGYKTGNYISTWGYITNLGNVTTNVDVDVDGTRAFMIDEGIDKDNNRGMSCTQNLGHKIGGAVFL